MYRRVVFVLCALGLALGPASGAGAADAPPPAEPAPAPPEPTGDHGKVVDITFPTDPRVSYVDSYEAPRSGGRVHKSTDLMGQKMWPIYAAVGGTVSYIPGHDGTPMPSYGYMISIKGDDGRKYDYIHLNNDTPGTDDGLGGPGWAYAPGLEPGSEVQRGEFIGFMGDSGNAESVGAHLHFEIEDPEVVDPYLTHFVNPYASLVDAEERGDYSSWAIPDITAGPPREAIPARSTELACPDGEVPEDGFADLLDGLAHEDAVDCVVWWEVAKGTSESTYGPGSGVTRAQMAAFMARLLEAAGVDLPADPEDRFGDDDGSAHELRINQLAQLGVVGGVAGGGYDPNGEVSRAQMATFLVRAVELATGHDLDTGDDSFGDDDGSPHEENVDKVAGAGLATGLTAARYGPNAGVRRDQMGSFVARTLDLLVEHGDATPPAR